MYIFFTKFIIKLHQFWFSIFVIYLIIFNAKRNYSKFNTDIADG
jgi:hypothetical protein